MLKLRAQVFNSFTKTTQRMKQFYSVAIMLAAALAAQAGPEQFKLKAPQPLAASRQAQPLRALSRADIPQAVTEQPAGQVLDMERNSQQYLNFYGMLLVTPTTTAAQVVMGDNGEVWFKDYISVLTPAGVWIKGELADGVISVAFPQIAYVEAYEGEVYEYPAYVYDPAVDEESLPALSADQTVTYTYADGVITQQGDGIVSLADGEEFMGYGDAEVSWAPFEGVAQTLPEGLKPEKWAMTWDGGGQFVGVSIDGDKLWLSDLTSDLPDAAVVGTIQGNKVTFEKGQYLGTAMGLYLAYFVPCRFVADEEGNVDMVMQDQLVMEYDATGRELKCGAGDEGFIINAGLRTVSYLSYYLNPRIFFQESAGQLLTPSEPTDLVYNEYPEDYWDLYGFGYIMFNLPMVAENGDLLDVNDLYYEVYVDDNEPVEFDPDSYVNLEEPMTLIPFGFSDGWDFEASGTSHAVYLWFTGFDRIGVQSVYVIDGKEARSAIVYNDGSKDVGIQALATEAGDAQPAYYDLMGRRVAQPQGGVFVKVQNGKATKVVK